MWGKSLQTLPGVPLAPAPRNRDPCLLSLTLQACAAIVVLQWTRVIYSWPEHHDHRGLQHSLPSPQFRELYKPSLPPPPGSLPRDGESPLLLSLTFLDRSQPCQPKHSGCVMRPVLCTLSLHLLSVSRVCWGIVSQALSPRRPLSTEPSQHGVPMRVHLHEAESDAMLNSVPQVPHTSPWSRPVEQGTSSFLSSCHP